MNKKEWLVRDDGIHICPECGYPSRSGPSWHIACYDEYDSLSEPCEGSPKTKNWYWIVLYIIVFLGLAYFVGSIAAGAFLVTVFVFNRIQKSNAQNQSA